MGAFAAEVEQVGHPPGARWDSVADDFLRLIPHAGPHRIDLAESGLLFGICLDHVPLTRPAIVETIVLA